LLASVLVDGHHRPDHQVGAAILACEADPAGQALNQARNDGIV
jgi:hypothetical protein